MGADHSSNVMEFEGGADGLITPGVKKVIVKKLKNVEVIYWSGYSYSLPLKCKSKLQIEMDLFTMTTLHNSDIQWIAYEIWRQHKK